jgi:chromosome segregation ATPase
VIVAFAALTGAAMWTSSREVELQRMEAERARQQADAQRTIAESARARAANFRDDLTEESRMRRALQQEIARLEREYQSSRMTRADLVTRLAQTEGELRMVTQRQAEASRQAAHDLTAVQSARDQLQAIADEQAATLTQARARVTALTEEEQQLRRRIGDIERERDQALERARVLRARLSALDPTAIPQNPFEHIAAEPSTDRDEEPEPTRGARDES